MVRISLVDVFSWKSLKYKTASNCLAVRSIHNETRFYLVGPNNTDKHSLRPKYYSSFHLRHETTMTEVDRLPTLLP